MIKKLEKEIAFLGSQIMSIASHINSIDALLVHIPEDDHDNRDKYTDELAEQIIFYHRISTHLLNKINEAIKYNEENNLPIDFNYEKIRRELLK